MQEWRKFMKSKYCDVSVYVMALLFIILSPIVAKQISPFFDYVGYGAMRPFFDELFTSIIWIVGIVIMAIIYGKKLRYNIISNPDTKGKELPMKRIIFIGIVVAACILVISAQIRFQVKPFYDLGEKFNGYELTNNLGIFIRNIVKCVWIIIMIKAAQSLVETITKKDKIIYPVAGIVLMFTLGIYDLITGMNNLPITYFFLYLVYGWIYLLTERSMSKSYLLILFVFMF